MHLRLLDPATDSFDALTTLLHRAYAPHAAKGLRYSATHQSAEVTRQRASQGECWVGELDGRIVATITVSPPGRRGGTGFYGRPDVAKFNQMAVDPDRKGQGLGRVLLQHAEARARAMGAAELACDTAVHARELHELYFRHGFRFVGHCDWRPYVNYTSIQVSKDLVGDAPATRPPTWEREADNAWLDRGPQVRAVFDAVWPGMNRKLELAAALGYPWCELSTAFLVDGAHVGVLELAARLGGRSVAIGGVHAVGTAPAARGTGAGRRALQRALRHVDERFATAVLTTTIPAYFEPHGFRVVPEHRFRVREPLPLGAATPLRRLSVEVPEDVAFVKQVLSQRTPSSRHLAVEEEGWFFVLDEVLAHGGFGALYAADDLGALVAWQRDGDRAQLLDVVAPALPPLAEIAARLPADLGGIDVLFCPDRLDVATDPVPGAPDETVLMVRGEWPLEGPLCLPLHARC